MPRTPSVTAHLSAPAAVMCLLGTATLLLAVGCSGGAGGTDKPASPGASAGGSASGDLGSSPPVEGGPGQPSAQRSSAGGNGGGFNAAGQVSGNISGSWPSVVVKVTNTSGSGTLAVTVGQVTDCTGGKVTATATPASTTESVPPGPERSFVFTFDSASAGSGARKICAKVSVGGSTVAVTDTIQGSDSSNGSGSTPPASRSSGGPSSSHSATGSANGGSTATATSTP